MFFFHRPSRKLKKFLKRTFETFVGRVMKVKDFWRMHEFTLRPGVDYDIAYVNSPCFFGGGEKSTQWLGTREVVCFPSFAQNDWYF